MGGKAIDLNGETFGRLTVIERDTEYYISPHGRKEILWICQCSCDGKLIQVNGRDLRREATKSCGCLQKELSSNRKLNDLTGRKFHYLEVIKRAEDKISKNRYRTVMWECLCKCGNIKVVSGKNLTRKNVRSCGCYSSEVSSVNGKIIAEKLNKDDKVFGTSIKSITSNKLSSKNTSGVIGVSYSTKYNKWVAQIGFQGKQYNLGSYKDKNEAIKVRKEAEENIFGKFLEWYYKEYKN